MKNNMWQVLGVVAGVCGIIVGAMLAGPASGATVVYHHPYDWPSPA